MEYLVWIGPRESDIQFSKCFQESICYYSEENSDTFRKAHIYGTPFLEFITNKMKRLLQFHPKAKFIFYNPKIAYGLDTDLRKHVLCLNEKYILNLLSDKIYTRFWMGNYIPVLPSLLLDSYHLSFSELNNRLGDSEAYVVQRNKSSGGFGTFFISKNNQMLNSLQQMHNELFIISPYVKNGLSINVNAVVDSDKIYYFPLSLQIIENNNNRLLYHGADYKVAQDLSSEIKKKIQNYSNIILEHVQALGYRGIIGIDFIIKGETVYFLEINPRYQASSFLIDAVLSAQGYPTLSEINIACFSKEWNIPLVDVQNITINYPLFQSRATLPPAPPSSTHHSFNIRFLGCLSARIFRCLFAEICV